MAIFWLKGVVGGKPPFCFLLEVANCWGVMASDYNGSISPGHSSTGNPFGDKEHDTISIAPAASVAPSVPGVDLDFRDSGPASSARVNFEHAVGAASNSLTTDHTEPIWNTGFWKCIFGNDSLGDALYSSSSVPCLLGTLWRVSLEKQTNDRRCHYHNLLLGRFFSHVSKALMTCHGKRSVKPYCRRRSSTGLFWPYHGGVTLSLSFA